MSEWVTTGSALSSGGKPAVLGAVFSSVRLFTHAVGESSEQVWRRCMGVGRKERFSSSPEPHGWDIEVA